ncbi:ATP-binding protein [Sutcliffiella sp. NPDC057660]|uniref:ATP-binding protein n=1 Tax=Sutcliffiella sp. NPDC057660 TaxID=3346199 RepID=UPI0036B771D8
MGGAEFSEVLTFEKFRLEEQTAIGGIQLNILKQLAWINECLTLFMMGQTCARKTYLYTALAVHTMNERGYQISFISMKRPSKKGDMYHGNANSHRRFGVDGYF